MEKYIRKLKIETMGINDVLEGFSQLPLVQKLNDMVMKDISLYKEKCRQRCFKCRIYGHIADECDKVCKECGYFHRNKICINKTIQMIQEVLSYSYMKFTKFYDENVKIINNMMVKKNIRYENLEICPCYQAQYKQNLSLRKYVTKKVDEKIMTVKEFEELQRKNMEKFIELELDNYADENKLSKNKINVSRYFPWVKDGYVIGIKDVQYQRIEKKNIFGIGSLIGANMKYKIDYMKPDYIVKNDVIVREKEKKVLKPIPKQVITISQGNNLKYKYQYGQFGNKLDRFNKIIRIYKKNDKLQELMDVIENYRKKLNKMECDYNNKVMNYVEISDKFKEAMDKYKIKVNELKEKYLKKKMETIEKQKYITKKITNNAKQTTQRLVNKIKERGYKLRDAANNATLHTQLNYLFDLARRVKECQVFIRDIHKVENGIYFKYEIINAGVKEYILNVKNVEVNPYHCPPSQSSNKELSGKIIQLMIDQVKNQTNKINDQRAGKKIAFKFESGGETYRNDSSDYYESDYDE